MLNGKGLILTEDNDEPEKVTSASVILPSSKIPPVVEIAFQDYKDLGPSRTITALHRHYQTRFAKDPYDPIPTTDLYLLAQWESQYNWRILAWEHDIEENRAFQEQRNEIMSGIYKGQLAHSKTLLEMAEKNLEIIKNKVDENGNPIQVLSPQEALMFMKEGVKIQREAQEALLKMKDPKEHDSGAGGDLFDNIRKMGFLQINVQNNYGGTPT